MVSCVEKKKPCEEDVQVALCLPCRPFLGRRKGGEVREKHKQVQCFWERVWMDE